MQPGPGRLQCNLCERWFRPAGLTGHKRFYHGEYRRKLQEELSRLVSVVGDRRVPEDIRFGLQVAWAQKSADLEEYRRRLQAIEAAAIVAGGKRP